MFKITYLLLLQLVFMVSITSIELKVSYGYHNAQPYAFIENNTLIGGVIKDIMDEVGLLLNAEIKYIDVPNKRQVESLESGRVDVLAIMNPAWIEEDADKFYWSMPLFTEDNIFVLSKDNSFKLDNHDDLNGKVLGCILGYYYRGLMDRFERNIIIREDAKSLKSNLLKLKSGRIDALIDSNITIMYTVKHLNIEDDFVYPEFVSTSYDVYFTYSKVSQIHFDKINSALQKLIDNGTLNQILKKYQ